MRLPADLPRLDADVRAAITAVLTPWFREARLLAAVADPSRLPEVPVPMIPARRLSLLLALAPAVPPSVVRALLAGPRAPDAWQALSALADRPDLTDADARWLCEWADEWLEQRRSSAYARQIAAQTLAGLYRAGRITAAHPMTSRWRRRFAQLKDVGTERWEQAACVVASMPFLTRPELRRLAEGHWASERFIADLLRHPNVCVFLTEDALERSILKPRWLDVLLDERPDLRRAGYVRDALRRLRRPHASAVLAIDAPPKELPRLLARAAREPQSLDRVLGHPEFRLRRDLTPAAFADVLAAEDADVRLRGLRALGTIAVGADAHAGEAVGVPLVTEQPLGGSRLPSDTTPPPHVPVAPRPRAPR